MLYCTGRTRSPSESLACVSASISYGPGSRDLKGPLERKKATQSKICTTQTPVTSSGKGQQDGSSVPAQGQKHRNQQQSKWVSKPEPRHRYRVCSNSKSPNSIVSDARSSLVSSPLVEEPARPLVRALGRALLGLHPVGQAGESRRVGSLTGCAGVGSTAATERLSDATEWVAGEVGLSRSGAEATSRTLLSSLKAFLDGKKLRLESVTISVHVLACDDGGSSGQHTCGWRP